MNEPLELTPLATVDHDSITAIFCADPTSLTDADLDKLVLELRRRRNEFIASEAAKAAKGKAADKKPKATVTAAEALVADKPTSELSLDDLI